MGGAPRPAAAALAWQGGAQGGRRATHRSRQAARPPGRQAARPPGRRAAGPPGRQAAGLPQRQPAARSSQAPGRQAHREEVLVRVAALVHELDQLLGHLRRQQQQQGPGRSAARRAAPRRAPGRPARGQRERGWSASPAAAPSQARELTASLTQPARLGSSSRPAMKEWSRWLSSSCCSGWKLASVVSSWSICARRRGGGLGSAGGRARRRGRRGRGASGRAADLPDEVLDARAQRLLLLRHGCRPARRASFSRRPRGRCSAAGGPAGPRAPVAAARAGPIGLQRRAGAAAGRSGAAWRPLACAMGAGWAAMGVASGSACKPWKAWRRAARSGQL
jgi:hypothetical protein